MNDSNYYLVEESTYDSKQEVLRELYTVLKHRLPNIIAENVA